MMVKTGLATLRYNRVGAHIYSDFLVAGEEFYVTGGTIIETLSLLPVKAVEAEIGQLRDDPAEYNDALLFMARKKSINFTAWPPEAKAPRGVTRVRIEEILSNNRGFEFSVISMGFSS